MYFVSKIPLMNRLFCISCFLLTFLLSCNSNRKENAADIVQEKINNKVQEAWDFVQREGYNPDFCFLIDFSIPSGKSRFFVWDFRMQEITHQFLVTHGACNGVNGPENLEKGVNFSNIVNSHCSSIGKYKVGQRDYSSWGIKVKYWLHGLEPTNNNAVRRVVVLHSWEAVPDIEVHPLPIVKSWGCPAVSNDAMMQLDALLKNTTRPTLLWIYI